MSDRHLVSIRRMVPATQRAEYDAAWHHLHSEITTSGAHAWRFQSLAARDLHLEFIEFKASTDPRPHPPIAAALHHLDSLFPAAAVEEWIGG
jgi:hypothetical protein